MIKSDYIPAIVTAIAGIFGIVINISVNTWYRHSDIKERQRLKDIDAYEVYYLPLYQLLIRLEQSLQNLNTQAQEKISIDLLAKYMSGEKSSPVSLRGSIRDVCNEINRLSDFVSSNSYKYIKDYKTMFYYDEVMVCVEALRKAKENSVPFPQNYSLLFLNNLIQRLDELSILIYTYNGFERVYLNIWKHKQTRCERLFEGKRCENAK